MSPSPTGSDPEQLRTPPGYEQWSADEKLAWLWDDLVLASSHAATTLPDLRLPFQARPRAEIGVVTRKAELEKALDRTDDLMEPGRPKVIHAHGAVAKIELETDDASACTGLLAPPPEGGATGLIRLSLVAKVVGKAAVTPAFGLKLLIDGRPSADVLAMNHVVGQGRDFDLFSNTMTNDLSDEHRELRPPQQIMSVLFNRISRQPRRLVCTHLVDQRRDGSLVDRPVEPRRLVFHPTPEARQVFGGQAGVDFRRVLYDRVPEGTVLYDIEALGAACAGVIGALRTRSRFVSSDGGDRLYFRHVQDPRDRKR